MDMNAFSLKGKTAWITGASYGIGFAIAEAYAAAGAKIVFNDINQELVDKGLKAYAEKGIDHEVSEDSLVSMNFWGFTPDYFGWSEELFRTFLRSDDVKTNPKAEFFIPYVADVLIKRNDATFKVLNCDAKWFGVTYKEDRPFVVEKIGELIEKGVYPRSLWG